MPRPCYMISRETVATSLKTVLDDGYEKIFAEMFAEVKIKLKALLSTEAKNPENCNFRPTIGGDGQELRASYRKGEISRRKKGAHGVVAYDCDNRVALAYTTVNRKNHEINGFIRILQNIELPDDAIFYADALNTRQNFIDFLKERHVDWIYWPLRNKMLPSSCTTLLRSALISVLMSSSRSSYLRNWCPDVSRREPLKQYLYQSLELKRISLLRLL